MDLTLLAKWTIRPRLMAIPGVANVAIWGQRDTQYQVLVDPDRLLTNGVTSTPCEGRDRRLDRGRRRLRRHAQPADRRAAPRHRRDARRPRPSVTVAFRNGAPLRLGDVAEVKVGFPPPIGDAVIERRRKPGLPLLIVEKQPTGNTLEVTRNVEEALEALKPGLKDVEVDPTIFRPATFIERSLDNLTEAMAVGCVLVVVDPGLVPVRLAHCAHQPDWRSRFRSSRRRS